MLVSVVARVQVVIVVAKIVAHDDFRAPQLAKVVVLKDFFTSAMPMNTIELLSRLPRRSDAGATILVDA